MSLVWTIAYVVVLLFFVALLVRIVFDVVQSASRSWRPRGLTLVAADAVYTVTDPPLRLLRRWVKPLRIGGIALDLAFMIVMLLAWFLLQIFATLAVS